MDVWDLTKLLFRRWRFSLPLLVLALAAVFVVGQTTNPDYKAKSYVTLIPPATPVGASPARNPWLNTGLNSLAKAAMFTLQSKSVADGFVANGLSENFTLTLEGPYEPIITIEAVGTTEAQASATARELARLIDTTVLSIQSDSGVGLADAVTTVKIRGDNVEISATKVSRAMIMVGALGLLITAAATIGLDAFLRRRRRPVGDDLGATSRRPAPSPASTWPNRAGVPASSPLLSATHSSAQDLRPSLPSGPAGLQVSSSARPAPTGSHVVEHGTARREHVISLDRSPAHGHTADDLEFVDPRSAPPADPIDSTIVLPLSAPGPRWNGDRGKRA